MSACLALRRSAALLLKRFASCCTRWASLRAPCCLITAHHSCSCLANACLPFPRTDVHTAHCRTTFSSSCSPHASCLQREGLGLQQRVLIHHQRPTPTQLPCRCMPACAWLWCFTCAHVLHLLPCAGRRRTTSAWFCFWLLALPHTSSLLSLLTGLSTDTEVSVTLRHDVEAHQCIMRPPL